MLLTELLMRAERGEFENVEFTLLTPKPLKTSFLDPYFGLIRIGGGFVRADDILDKFGFDLKVEIDEKPSVGEDAFRP